MNVCIVFNVMDGYILAHFKHVEVMQRVTVCTALFK